MARASILKLSIAQALGLAVTSLGGTAVWLIVVALAAPADLGALGRLISTSTLVASLLTAGLGQFLLGSIGSTPVGALRPRLLWSLALGGGVSGLVAFWIGLVQGGPPTLLVGMAVLAAGIAVTNLQDALYLAVGMAADVPAKGMVVVLLRVGLLGALWPLGAELPALAGAFVLSQLVAGCGWGLLRAPAALRRHTPADNSGPQRLGAALGLSYLYSIAVTSITVGIPAIATSMLPAVDGGLFYLAWTLAGLLGGVSVGVANAVLAASGEAGGAASRLVRVVCVQATILCVAGFVLYLVAPRALAQFAAAYRDANPILGALILGQIAFGLSLAALAACRARGQGGALAALIGVWAALIFGGAACGLGAGALTTAYGFAAGCALALLVAAYGATRSAATGLAGATTMSEGI